VDHIHFQYNGFLYGLLLLSICKILQVWYEEPIICTCIEHLLQSIEFLKVQFFSIFLGQVFPRCLLVCGPPQFKTYILVHGTCLWSLFVCKMLREIWIVSVSFPIGEFSYFVKYCNFGFCRVVRTILSTFKASKFTLDAALVLVFCITVPIFHKYLQLKFRLIYLDFTETVSVWKRAITCILGSKYLGCL
jgi:hypothetical protein